MLLVAVVVEETLIPVLPVVAETSLPVVEMKMNLGHQLVAAVINPQAPAVINPQAAVEISPQAAVVRNHLVLQVAFDRLTLHRAFHDSAYTFSPVGWKDLL